MYEPLLPDIYLFATTVNFNVQLLSATESKALASASEMQQNSAGLCKNSLDENGWYYIEKKNIYKLFNLPATAVVMKLSTCAAAMTFQVMISLE